MEEVKQMINVLLISLLLVALYIVCKYMYYGGSVSFKNHYISKSSIIPFVVHLALNIVLFLLWVRLLGAMLSPTVSRMIDNNLSDFKENVPVLAFIYFVLLLIVIVTVSLMNKILKHSYYTVITLLRIRSQKKNTITNIFLKAIHNESDEIIVEKYKTMKKAPLLPSEMPRLSKSEEMKLISALLNMREYEEATKLSKSYVRSNMKLVKNKIALKPLAKSKRN